LADSTLEQVRARVAELETQCHALAPLVDNRDWHGFEALLVGMRRSRHALANAWEAAQPERTAQFESEIRTRVQRILEYRQYQIGRIDQVHGETGERLRLISRWKSYARSVARKRGSQTSPLFSDIR
jgi:hypothetical protein